MGIMAMKTKVSSEIKGRIVLEVLRQEKTLAEIASSYGLSPAQITQWKKVGIENLKLGFSKKQIGELKELKELTDELYSQIGRLKVENDWLKKKLGA